MPGCLRGTRASRTLIAASFLTSSTGQSDKYMAFTSLTGIRRANTYLVPQCRVCVCVCVMPGLTQLQRAYLSWELILMPTSQPYPPAMAWSPSALDLISVSREETEGRHAHTLNQSQEVPSPENILGAPSPCRCPSRLQTCMQAVYTFMHGSPGGLARPVTIPDHSSPPAQELPHSLGRARRQHTHQAHTIPLAKGLSSPPPLFPQPPPRAGPITLQARAPPRWRGGGQGTPTGGPATSQGGEKAQD